MIEFSKNIFYYFQQYIGIYESHDLYLKKC